MPKQTRRAQFGTTGHAGHAGHAASPKRTFIAHTATLAALLCAILVRPALADETAAGKAIFDGDCANCHTLRASETAKRGPHLENLLQRRFGAVEGFPYRMVWTQADPRWTPKHLDDYLVIHGRADEAGRKALIDYLIIATRP